MPKCRLIIEMRDGKLWIDQEFNSPEQAERWLTEEKTRHYWKDSFVVNKVVIPDPVRLPDPEGPGLEERLRLIEEKLGIKHQSVLGRVARAMNPLRLFRREQRKLGSSQDSEIV